MRALRIVCAASVLALVIFAMALEFPALTARAARVSFGHASGVRSGKPARATTPPRTTRAARQTSESAAHASSTSTANSASTPIVIAQNVAARSLATEPQPEAPNAAVTNSAAAQSALLYLTAADKPNQIFTLAATFGRAPADKRAISTSTAVGKMALFAGQPAAGSMGDGGTALDAEFDLLLASQSMRSGLVLAPDGTVVLADTLNSTIRTLASAGSSEPGIVRSVAGRFGSPQSLDLIEPLGLALDRAGNLYIADHAANTIYILRASTGALEPLAHVASPANVGVTLDGSTVFASSPDTGAIVSINTKTRAIRSVNIPTALLAPAPEQAQTHVQAISPSTGAGESAESKIIPAGLAVDGAGNLFVAFSGAGPKADQILRVDAFRSKVTSAARGLSAPGEIAFDSNGNLFVADQGSRRVLEFQREGVPATGVTLTPPVGPVPTDYGDEPIAGATPAQTFTLTNNSGAAISQISTSFESGLANFTVTSTSCTATLANNSSCLYNVTFTPQSSGALTDTLVVAFTPGANPPATVSAAVSGTGDDFQVTAANGIGPYYPITIDPGASATYMMQIVPDNTFSGAVTLVCPTNLPQATTCTFTPMASNPPPNTLVVNVTPGTPVPFSMIFQTTGPTVKATTGFWPAIFAGSQGEPSASGAARIFARFPALRLALPLTFALVLGAFAFRKGFRSGGLQAGVFFFGLFAPQTKSARLNAAATGPCPHAQSRPTARSARRLAAVFALLVMFAGVAAVMGGCGKGSSTKPIVTPAGTTNLTVQATAQNASRGFTVTLIVN